jgi:hypothetical protein
MSLSPIFPQVESNNGELRVSQHDVLRDQSAEIAAEVTPVNYAFPPGDVDRYLANNNEGSTDMAPAFNAAFKVAKTSGHDVTFGRRWPYLLASPIDATQDTGSAQYGYSVRNIGNCNADTNNPPTYPCILTDHTGHVFDCAGAVAINWYDVSIGEPASSSAKKTGWFLARNSAESGSIHRFHNCRARLSCSEAVVYNYGAEDDIYNDCQFFNTNTGGNAHWMLFTSNNIRSLSSTFITIATGNQSTIGHFINGGSFALFTDNASGKGLYLENIRLFKMIGPHIICGHMGVAAHSHVFIDTTNGASDNLTMIGVSGEQSSPSPNYGIYAGDTAVTMGNWLVLSCTFPNSINSIKGHANVNWGGLKFWGINNESTGGGVNLAGTVNTSYIDNVDGGLTIGTRSENNIDTLSKVISTPGDAYLRLRDENGATNEKNYQIRSDSGQFRIDMLSDAGAVTNTPFLIDRTTSTPDVMQLSATAYKLGALPGSYANDAAASAAGIAIGQLYRNGSVAMIRVT